MSNIRDLKPPKRIPASISDRAEKDDGYVPKADTIDDPTPVVESAHANSVESASSSGGRRINSIKAFPATLPEEYKVIYCQYGKAYLVVDLGEGHRQALEIGGQKSNNIIRKCALEVGVKPSTKILNETNDYLTAIAQDLPVTYVYYRVARTDDGYLIDVGDASGRIIEITKNGVGYLKNKSNVIFRRTSAMRSLPDYELSDDFTQSINLFKKYISVDWLTFKLLIAWITYTIVHPKEPSTNYVFLVIQGGQGTGKTTLTKLLLSLIDPSIIGAQSFPSKVSDFAISANHAHLLCYDNMRNFRATTSDVLCQCSSGATISNRKLFTDSDLNLLYFHVALILNGIHSFISQPDLAQRCLTIRTEAIKEGERLPEHQLNQQLEVDLPKIYGGLLSLISAILSHLPTVKPSSPERMIDFCYWLAAMEKAEEHKKVATNSYIVNLSSKPNWTHYWSIHWLQPPLSLLLV